MTALTPELQDLVDRQKIYHVLTSYCRALDRCDVGLMKTVYWEDGIDVHGVFSGNAHEFAEYIIRGVEQWFESAQHLIGNVHMEFDGDVAHVETYMFSFSRVAANRAGVKDWFGETYLKQWAGVIEAGVGQDFFFGGRYCDRFEKRGGIWRIAKRTVVMDWNLNQPATEIRHEGLFKTLDILGRRGRGDPAYRR
jgi:SnoaL-like domain